MSELVHKKDGGIMKPINVKDLLQCSKCGYKVRKNQIHQKYEQGILEIPI